MIPPRGSIARELLFRFAALIMLAPVLASIVILIAGEQGPDQRTNIVQERKADAAASLVRINGSAIALDTAAVSKRLDLEDARIAIYAGRSPEPVARWPTNLELRSWDEFGGYDTVRWIKGQPLRMFFAPPANSWSAWFDWYSDELTDEMLPIALILLGVSLPLALITIRRGLAPVRKLAWEAGQIEPGDGRARLSEQGVPTELLALVRAINAGLERLEAGFESQRRFSAVVAHELRTPIAILMMHLENEPSAPALGEARMQALRMRRLVDQLLMISEMSSRRLKLNTIVDIEAVARDIIAQEAPRAIESGVAIELEHQGSLKMKANAAAFGAALRNLINNAVRHSSAGGRVLVRILGERNAVEVWDDGPGVPDAEKGKIFEPFWKNPRSKGAGVGLAIVREMAALHDGSVSLRDNLPHGAIFRIDFPKTAGKSAFCSG